MEDPNVPDIARVIQLSLAPAFLLTGVASLLNVFGNRLARIVDRIRALERQPQLDADSRDELEVLGRRGKVVRSALIMGTAAAFFVSLVIAVAFLGFLLGVHVSAAVAGLFVAAMAALTLALAFFLREVTLAIGSLEAYLPRAILRSRRRGPDPAGDDDAPAGGA